MRAKHTIVLALAILFGLSSYVVAEQGGAYFRLKTQASHFVPPTGYVNVWAKSGTGHVYRTDETGTDYDLSSAVSGGGTGTVTSVAMTVPAIMSVAGSPVTTSGTLAVSLATQAANKVWCGPTSGGSTTPTFRSLVTADFPNSGVTAASYGDATHVAACTYDVTGRATTCSSTSITGLAESAITSLVSDLAAKGALAAANTWTASQNVAAVALTDASTVATNAALGNTFTLTLTGNHTLGNPTNLVAGGTYQWIVTQSGGSNTLAYSSDFKWPGGTAPTLSTAASAVDIISCSAKTTSILLCVFQGNFS